MMKIFIAALLSAIAIFTQQSLAAVTLHFNDYPTQPYYGRVSAPDLGSHPDARTYRTRLRNAAKGPVNFAGKYVLATWGCGSSCLMGAVINARTGQVTFLPKTVCCWDTNVDNPIDYRADSNMIIFTGHLNEEDPMGSHYYEFSRGRFNFIQKQIIATNAPETVQADIIIPSSATRVPSSGANRDVTDFTLINDTNVEVTITWLDGNSVDVDANGGDQTGSRPWLKRGDSWRVENGARTWESHWYAVSSVRDFICSFSPRQNEIARLSELDACKSALANYNPQTVPATCPSGYVLSGGRCERDVAPSPTCPSGYIYSQGQCVSNSTNNNPSAGNFNQCVASCEKRGVQCDRELTQLGDAQGWDGDLRQSYWDDTCVPEINACKFACNPKGSIGPGECRFTRDGGQICS